MFGRVAKTVIGRSWGTGARPSAEAACGIAPLEEEAINPRDAFFEIVDRVAREERLPAHLAMAKVKVERPNLFWAAFPQERRRPVKPAAPGRVHARSQLFELVSETARRERIPEHVAMGKARAELLAAWA